MKIWLVKELLHKMKYRYSQSPGERTLSEQRHRILTFVLIVCASLLTSCKDSKPTANSQIPPPPTVLPEVYGFYLRDGSRLVRLDVPTGKSKTADGDLRVAPNSTFILFDPKLRQNGVSDAGRVLQVNKRMFVRLYVDLFREGENGPLVDQEVFRAFHWEQNRDGVVFDIRPVPAQTEMAEFIPREGSLSGNYDVEHEGTNRIVTFGEPVMPKDNLNLTGEYFDAWRDMDIGEKGKVPRYRKSYSTRYETAAKLTQQSREWRQEAIVALGAGKTLRAGELLQSAGVISEKQIELEAEWTRVEAASIERAETALATGDPSLALVYGERAVWALLCSTKGNALEPSPDPKSAWSIRGKCSDAFKKWKVEQAETLRIRQASLSEPRNELHRAQGMIVRPPETLFGKTEQTPCVYVLFENVVQVITIGKNPRIIDTRRLDRIHGRFWTREFSVSLPNQGAFDEGKPYWVFSFRDDSSRESSRESLEFNFDSESAREKFSDVMASAIKRAKVSAADAGVGSSVSIEPSALGLDYVMTLTGGLSQKVTIPNDARRIKWKSETEYRPADRVVVSIDGQEFGDFDEDTKFTPGQTIRLFASNLAGNAVEIRVRFSFEIE